MPYRARTPSERFTARTVYRERQGLIDIGATSFTSYPLGATPGGFFGFGCGCTVSITERGQETRILAGCCYAHPFAFERRR